MSAGQRYLPRQAFSEVIQISEHQAVTGISEVLVMVISILKKLSEHLTGSIIRAPYQLNGKMVEWTGSLVQKRRVNLFVKLIFLLRILLSMQLLKKNKPSINLTLTLTLT